MIVTRRVDWYRIATHVDDAGDAASI